MTTRFLLVRHGQTAWNKDLHFRGTTDLPLSDLGFVQAQRIAEWLRGEPIRAIYSSPLLRAVQTAQPLADALGLPVQIHNGLVSADYGEWQGHTPKEVSQLWPDLYQKWLHAPHEVQFPGGESLPIVLERAVVMLNELTTQYSGQTVVLFSHEIVCKAVMLHVLGMDLAAYWRMPQDNGCINAFFWDLQRRSLIYLNDTCHLRGLEDK